jgi:hypothetical protein
MEGSMTQALSLAIAGLLIAGAASYAFVQNAPANPSFKLEVVLNHFEGEAKTGTLPFLFAIGLNQKGSLRVDGNPDRANSPNAADPCPGATQSSSLMPSVGTQVDSVVSPLADGRFGVELTFTERARAGCRDINGLLIPVFSNRIVARSVTLKDGESKEIVFTGDPARQQSTRVTVTLTIRN